MKAELRHLLAQPLVARGVMKKYITSGARSVVSELLKHANAGAGADGTASELRYCTLLPTHPPIYHLQPHIKRASLTLHREI